MHLAWSRKGYKLYRDIRKDGQTDGGTVVVAFVVVGAHVTHSRVSRRYSHYNTYLLDDSSFVHVTHFFHYT